MKRISQKLVILISLAVFSASGFVYIPSAKAETVAFSSPEAASTTPAVASETLPANPAYAVTIDKNAVKKGYTVGAFGGAIKLSLTPGVLKEETGVEVIELKEELPLPWRLNKLSPIYQFEFKNKKAYDSRQPFNLELAYNRAAVNYKQVFFYDKGKNAWRPLPTTDAPDKLYVRSAIHLPFARLAVFEYPEILAVGQASWYKHKGGLYAASPDFPKGSIIRVYNIDSDIPSPRAKYVDVKINDFGPDRAIHPDRAIDLDKAAFKKLAALSHGTIKVKIEPLYIPLKEGVILGLSQEGAKMKPTVTAKAVAVADEATGEIIWSKEADSVLPIASLTKLVALKIFFDTRLSLDQTVNYSLADEEYNYQYAEKWQSARLKLKDNEPVKTNDLVYAALVGSANNAVETLVRASGLARQDFIDKMNEAVLGWGASSTRFVEPTGLAPANVSSARDYVIISRQTFAHPIIEKASTMKSYKFTTALSGKHSLTNTNRLIGGYDYKITGGKTGYLDEAGYNLVTRARDYSGKEVLVVTLGAGSRETSFSETKELIKYGLYQARNSL